MIMAFLIASLAQSPTATKEDYAGVVTLYENYAKRLNDGEFWKKVQVDTNDKRGIVQFDKISLVEQRIFVYMMAARLTAEGEKLQRTWDAELKKFEKDSYKSGDPKVAGPDEVKRQASGLLQARKKLASELEIFVAGCRKELKGLANDYELDDMEKKVRRTHETMKLAEKR